MPDNKSDSTSWKLLFFDDDTKTEYDHYFRNYPKQEHVRVSFEKDVTENPFFHPVFRRIVPLKGSYKGKYRYGKSKTRIIYEPIRESKIVYPITIDKVTDIQYKKRSKKK